MNKVDEDDGEGALVEGCVSQKKILVVDAIAKESQCQINEGAYG